MHLERAAGRSRLWIMLGCEPADASSRADAIPCEYPLAWNKATKQFEFAPLSTIKLPAHVPDRN